MQDDDIPPAEADEFSRAFDLYVSLDEAKATAARLRAASDRTTGLEREANIRQAAEAETEIARIEAELDGEAHHGRAAAPKRETQAETHPGPTERATSAGGRIRHDDIQIEIDDAKVNVKQRGEHVTPAKVMALLRARAGRPDSCIYDTAPNGVLWTRGSSGEPEKLTMEALKKRISRGANGTLRTLRGG